MQIIFKHFIVETTIGVYEYEKQQKREIPISLLIDFDATTASQSDDLSDTIDYDKVAHILNNIAQNHNFNLLEKMAQIIIDELVAQFPIINYLEVEISKPGVVNQAQNIAIKEFYKKPINNSSATKLVVNS